MPQMNSILGHMGAWAPKAEQIATAGYLANTSDVSSFVADLNAKILRRLDRLHTTIQKLKAEGLKVDSLQPQGGIYLSAMFDYVGAKTPQGKQLATGNDLRQFLLEDARVAMVPFAAFGAKDHTGWFRMSVGAVSEEQVEQSLVRLAASLRQLSS
jgi:aspartate aminotransferase